MSASPADFEIAFCNHKLPGGAVVKQTGKTRITIYIDDDVLEVFRERADQRGRGYQTMMNQALREVSRKVVRRVLREELQGSR